MSTQTTLTSTPETSQLLGQNTSTGNGTVFLNYESSVYTIITNNCLIALGGLSTAVNGIALLLLIKFRQLSSLRKMFPQLAVLCVSDLAVSVTGPLPIAPVSLKFTRAGCALMFLPFLGAMLASQAAVTVIVLKRHRRVQQIRHNLLSRQDKFSNGIAFGSVLIIVVLLFSCVPWNQGTEPISDCNIKELYLERSGIITLILLAWLIGYMTVTNVLFIRTIWLLKRRVSLETHGRNNANTQQPNEQSKAASNVDQKRTENVELLSMKRLTAQCGLTPVESTSFHHRAETDTTDRTSETLTMGSDLKNKNECISTVSGMFESSTSKLDKNSIKVGTRKMNQNASKILTILVLLLNATFLPTFVMSGLAVSGYYIALPIKNILWYWMTINSLLNPFVYLGGVKDIRNFVMRLFRRR